ncbi:MAG: hypothetical protein ACR2PJ_03625 [Pseudomonadales bacterium]
MSIIKTLKAIAISLVLLALAGSLAGCINTDPCPEGEYRAWPAYNCVSY